MVVLLKIFVKGFYREHGGLLVFALVSIVTYGFFINVLDENHIPSGEIVLHNLGLVLALLESPAMLMLVFVSWFFLTIKSWTYITKELKSPSTIFLLYSITAAGKWYQYKGWFIVQLCISLPLIIYGLFALLIGLLFGYYVVPVIILAFVFLLSALSAAIYLKECNASINSNNRTFIIMLFRKMQKGFASLDLLNWLNNQKMSMFISKIFSFTILLAGSIAFTGIENQESVAAMLSLTVAMAHSILLWQSNVFQREQLMFTRNLPCSLAQRFFIHLRTWMILTVFEDVWIIVHFELLDAVSAIVLNVLTGLLLRSLLYRISPKIRSYLLAVFCIFTFLFMMILGGIIIFFIPVLVIITWWVFSTSYYHPSPSLQRSTAPTR